MNRSDFRFSERLRVRWAEIDAQKIVFNGHYLMYFDTAVAGYWRALAMPYAETMAQLDGDLFVRKATLDYLGSARYDDVLDIAMRCGASATRRCCSAVRCFEPTACWCRANWSTCSPTPSSKLPSRCRRLCVACSKASKPARRWSM